MFEMTFQRPTNFFKRSLLEQWDIDKRLGILAWRGDNLSKEDVKRFEDHYRVKK